MQVTQPLRAASRAVAAPIPPLPPVTTSTPAMPLGPVAWIFGGAPRRPAAEAACPGAAGAKRCCRRRRYVQYRLLLRLAGSTAGRRPHPPRSRRQALVSQRGVASAHAGSSDLHRGGGGEVDIGH